MEDPDHEDSELTFRNTSERERSVSSTASVLTALTGAYQTNGGKRLSSMELFSVSLTDLQLLGQHLFHP